ncbi:hypothetical protein [Methanothrix soehngenii]|uniref:hypothetical protein n=1 Tax=Methanothrix soehngenii TaxID=2223 RepID=UPI00300DA58B
MAGVFEQLIRPQNKAVHRDLKAMELEAAKEILAEVFRVRLSEVDEMIRCRFEAGDMGSMASEDWPMASRVLPGGVSGWRDPRPSDFL